MPSLGRDQIRLLSLLAGGLVFSLCSWQLGNLAIERVLQTDAKATADEWADYLEVALPDVGTILDGQALSKATTDFIAKTQKIGSIFRYRLYDTTGTIRLDSRTEVDGDDDEEPDTIPAMQAFHTGVPIFKASTGDGTILPSYYAEAYLPLVLKGQPSGALEVYVDQTEKASAIRAEFVWTGLAIAGLTALGFLLPLGAYLLKTREARKTISYVSQHDELTQLSNRAAFKDIVTAQLTKVPAAAFDVFFIDLDRFKSVNDSRGHAAGDAMLRQVASRLRDAVGTRGAVARLGGDQFAIFGPATGAAGDDADLGPRLVASLGAPFDLSGVPAEIGASIGVAAYPADGVTVDALLKAAEIALYEAKQSGGACSVRFERDMEERVNKRLALEARLRDALLRNKFALYYQPLLDLEANKLAGFEALLRLCDEAEAVSPAVFIPIAEKMGLIEQIGGFALAAACQTAALWPDDLKVAVNLSPLQFESGELVATVKSALAASDLDPRRLELEVTEGILIGDTVSVLSQLKELKTLGISIALDDFGTGYSSLSYLWMFPFDRVKVDRSFITRLSDADAKSREVLSSILALGRSLEMSITAEGVETAEQSAIVKAMHVDTLQGFLFGRPIPETELAATILKLGNDLARAGDVEAQGGISRRA